MRIAGRNCEITDVPAMDFIKKHYQTTSANKKSARKHKIKGKIV